MVDKYGNLRTVQLGMLNVEYYLFSQQYSGMGCSHAECICSQHIDRQAVSSTHQVLELWAVWLGLQAFCHNLDNATCSHSCNTSAVAYLIYQVGGGGKIPPNEWSSSRHMPRGWKSGNTLVPRHIPGHLNVLVDHLSRIYQILKTEWSLDQTIVDRVFHLWGKPHVDLFALERNVKLATCMSPIPEPMSWKVDSLVQSCRNPYAYVYPPTSLIRACLNKSGQRT